MHVGGKAVVIVVVVFAVALAMGVVSSLLTLPLVEEVVGTIMLMSRWWSTTRMGVAVEIDGG